METWRQVCVLVGLGMIFAGLGVEAIRRSWHRADPPYVGDRKRLRHPASWHREPLTGELIVTPRLERAREIYMASLTRAPSPSEEILPAHPSWPMFSPVSPAPIEPERRSLRPAWREAILDPGAGWAMPDDGRRHHHRAVGKPGEGTRRLHPGYVAEARARVAGAHREPE